MDDNLEANEAERLVRHAFSYRPVVTGVIVNVVVWALIQKFNLKWYGYLFHLSLIPTALMFWIKYTMRKQLKQEMKGKQ